MFAPILACRSLDNFLFHQPGALTRPCRARATEGPPPSSRIRGRCSGLRETGETIVVIASLGLPKKAVVPLFA